MMALFQQPVGYPAASGPAATSVASRCFCALVKRAGRPGEVREVRLANCATRKACSQA